MNYTTDLPFEKRLMDLICTKCYRMIVIGLRVPDGVARPSHLCPYKAEINGDSHTLCTCCPDCEYECAQDI